MSSDDDAVKEIESDTETSDSDGDNEPTEADSNSQVDDAETKAADALLKENNVASDITLIREIFGHIDQTSKRIMSNFALQEECHRLKEEGTEVSESNKIKKSVYKAAPVVNGPSEKANEKRNDVVTWSQYEELNDGQRAELLERSLQILTSNNNA